MSLDMLLNGGRGSLLLHRGISSHAAGPKGSCGSVSSVGRAGPSRRPSGLAGSWRGPAWGVALLALSAGAVRAADWQAVAAHPERFLNQEIVFPGAFCGEGGPAGADPGLYFCSIGKGALFVQSRRANLAPAARERMKGCGGFDVFERSSFCRFTVTVVPRRVRQSRDFDEKRSLPLLEGDAVDLR